jgi:purine-binding chemotaxis protein CheW
MGSQLWFMNGASLLMVFELDGQRYALHLPVVERVVRAVEITRLPKAPGIVLGVINVQGRIIPVVDVRKRFGLPLREMTVDDHIIVARTLTRSVAMVVDVVSGIAEYSETELVPKEKILPGIEHIRGVAKLGDGLVLIHDLEQFLSLEEQRSLDEALAKA